ncbi:LysR family transcriptional regulator, partial [Pseudooceanicola nanhaiensis]|uniref:LysR family transcriptional regulator n=1 Tax=Pseudooceanicola nanhaiensis TaxID=375761 RepID=UPI00405986F3
MSVAPPFPRLPSLNVLRAFEASARLGGFALAAEELRVTPGAVAAQIKNLESEVGAPLFKRNAQGVQLTEIGARALPGLRRGIRPTGGGRAGAAAGRGAEAHSHCHPAGARAAVAGATPPCPAHGDAGCRALRHRRRNATE